jgi:hypothetical protein
MRNVALECIVESKSKHTCIFSIRNWFIVERRCDMIDIEHVGDDINKPNIFTIYVEDIKGDFLSVKKCVYKDCRFILSQNSSDKLTTKIINKSTDEIYYNEAVKHVCCPEC